MLYIVAWPTVLVEEEEEEEEEDFISLRRSAEEEESSRGVTDGGMEPAATPIKVSGTWTVHSRRSVMLYMA